MEKFFEKRGKMVIWIEQASKSWVQNIDLHTTLHKICDQISSHQIIKEFEEAIPHLSDNN